MGASAGSGVEVEDDVGLVANGTPVIGMEVNGERITASSGRYEILILWFF